MTPHMQTMHNRLMEANNASYAPNQLTAIKEEASSKKGNRIPSRMSHISGQDYGQANYGATQQQITNRTQRKNSI